jgi:hypothetical protein
MLTSKRAYLQKSENKEKTKFGRIDFKIVQNKEFTAEKRYNTNTFKWKALHQT